MNALFSQKPGWQPDGSYILDDGTPLAEFFAALAAIEAEARPPMGKSRAGRKWGMPNPQHKYLSRKWDARRKKWRYEYGRQMSNGEIHAIAHDERMAWQLVLEKDIARWVFETNHTLPAWTQAKRHKVTSQLAKGAALLTISFATTGKVVNVYPFCLDDIEAQLHQARQDGFVLRSKTKLGAVPDETGREWAHSGGLKKVLSALYPFLLDQPVEHAFCFDQLGDLRWQRVGNDVSVRVFDGEGVALRDGVFVHNHPSGKSFSLTDVELAVQENMAEIQVVGWRRDGRAVLYTMTRPESGWVRPVSIMPNPLSAEFHYLASTRYPVWCEAVEQGQMTAAHAEDEFRHEIWETISQRLGISYTQEFLDVPGPPPGRRELNARPERGLPLRMSIGGAGDAVP